MTEPSDGDDETNVPMLLNHDPSQYNSQDSKERFAVAKFYGMGSDGEWTVEEIADEMGVGERQVYRYLNESEIGKEVREVLAVTEAEWRLDMALQLRREVQRLEDIEEELLQAETTVATDYETKTVSGTPTGDRNISLADHAAEYDLKLPVPSNFETVTDYGKDLERVQEQKRKYIDKIADLLGLDAADKKEVDRTLTERREEVKIVNVRETDDDYPEVEPVTDADDANHPPEEIAVEAVETPAEEDSSTPEEE